jgi:hypothetical protein
MRSYGWIYLETGINWSIDRGIGGFGRVELVRRETWETENMMDGSVLGLSILEGWIFKVGVCQHTVKKNTNNKKC